MGYRDGDIPETDDELYAAIAPRIPVVSYCGFCDRRIEHFGRDGVVVANVKYHWQCAPTRGTVLPEPEFEQFEAGDQVRIKRDAETVFANRPGVVESQHPETGTVNVKLYIDSERLAVALPFAASEVQEEGL